MAGMQALAMRNMYPSFYNDQRPSCTVVRNHSREPRLMKKKKSERERERERERKKQTTFQRY